MPTPGAIQIATELRSRLAGTALTPGQAKLYSQRIRRDMGQAGLASFSPNDVFSYLEEAMFLVECALIERGADPSGKWRDGVKRAGEILEWLSQSDLKPAGIPMHFLTAGAYQLAGFPAMALGHLQHMPNNEPVSSLLQRFLCGDFPATLEAVQLYWRDQHVLEHLDRVPAADMTILAIRHTVMCIGTICTYFRTGSIGLVERALNKLDSLASGFLYSRDAYSYLLARLTAETCRRYVGACLWSEIGELSAVSTPRAGQAFDQFARAAFINRRQLVWPAQAVGIARLREGTSFVLCTPTGSGKTSVATLAIVQGLFAEPQFQIAGLEGLEPGSLILYLVPSRALAAEVEWRLSQDLRGIAAEPVIVTGLYGGVDWGPTDAWIQADRPTIVICTFEKADALLRYLGVLFLSRVRLVVVDEAHMVEQESARLAGPEDASSRAYRLEQLGTRLLYAQEAYDFRIVALSAVAARAAPALARWIGRDENASPATGEARSTRQMLGRLQVNTNGRFSIHYDLMDGRSLSFDDGGRANRPFISTSFRNMPGGIDPNAGPEIGMRAPTLWAALFLAAERPDGTRPSVLISLTQNIDTFAASCVEFLDSWQTEQLPNYWALDETDERWIRCLAIVADYFTTDSVEYRLLQRGVAVHHGKLPGLVARRLKAVIDAGFVRVIIATSTLSEGVNIPVNYLLIPSVIRATNVFTVQEFTNLIGRAGRPGVATEGHALVVLPERVVGRQWNGYVNLVRNIERTAGATGTTTPEDAASSPLLNLLVALEAAWRDLAQGGTAAQFTDWLESTAVTEGPDVDHAALRYLDSLDGFLLSAIQEVEELRGDDIPADAIEVELTRIWQRTYAFASRRAEDRLKQIWLDRGNSVKQLYSDPGQRRQIYKTSLSPRSAIALLERAQVIKVSLLDGSAYADFEIEERFAFVRNVLAQLSEVPSFRIATRLGRNRNFHDWPRLLRWWLAKSTLGQQPQPREITTWYDFVSQNFIYRGAWGLGSILGLLLDAGDGENPVRAIEIDDWPRSGLPWIAFWLKELITWGTLDPVAAFLLARGNIIDRPQAEAEANVYYAQCAPDLEPNDVLDPRRIREWMGTRWPRAERPVPLVELIIDATLERAQNAYLVEHITVAPVSGEDRVSWIDPAGYAVAQSPKPSNWPAIPADYSFELDVRSAQVRGKPYLPYK